MRSLDDGEGITDGRRIVTEGGAPLLDIYTVAYRHTLPVATLDETKDTVGGRLRLIALQLAYFLRALLLVFNARKRAKSTASKIQLVYGYGMVLALLLLVVFTVLAVLAALGILSPPRAGGSFGDAVAIGLTGITTWLLTKVRPAVRQAAAMGQILFDYADNRGNIAVDVANCVATAVDCVLEKHPERRIFIVGYSLGALAAVDFLFPRISGRSREDPRVRERIAGLVTIGCPVDFIRLFIPTYLAGRKQLVPNLAWTNVFIAADVFGSNFVDGDDSSKLADRNRVAAEAETPAGGAVAVDVAGLLPSQTVQYTDEVLSFISILRVRGYATHGGYWSVPGSANCLNEVLDMALTSPPSAASMP